MIQITPVWMACSTDAEGRADGYIGMYRLEEHALQCSGSSGIALAPRAESRRAIEIGHNRYVLIDRAYEGTVFVLGQDNQRAKKEARTRALAKLTLEEIEALEIKQDR